MKVTFLYWEGCPSHELALARLRKVLREEGIPDDIIQVIHIKTQEDAIRHRFIGSPTIRINGKDIDPQPQIQRYGLACRPYRITGQRWFPIPSEQMIRQAIQRAVNSSSEDPLPFSVP